MKKNDEIKDLLESYLLVARQQMAPSRVLLEIQNSMKNLEIKVEEIVIQTNKTNGRVTVLERWKLVLSTTLFVLLVSKFPAIAHLVQSF